MAKKISSRNQIWSLVPTAALVFVSLVGGAFIWPVHAQAPGGPSGTSLGFRFPVHRVPGFPGFPFFPILDEVVVQVPPFPGSQIGVTCPSPQLNPLTPPGPDHTTTITFTNTGGGKGVSSS
jgi:hypothetical protein